MTDTLKRYRVPCWSVAEGYRQVKVVAGNAEEAAATVRAELVGKAKEEGAAADNRSWDWWDIVGCALIALGVIGFIWQHA